MDLNFGGLIGGLVGGAAGFGMIVMNTDGESGRFGKLIIALVTGGAVAGNVVWSKVFPKKSDPSNSTGKDDV